MLRHEIEDRIVGLIMGIGIGTVIGFFLRASDHHAAVKSQQP